MGKAGRIAPGPIGTGLVITGSLIESRSEGKSWGRALYGASVDVVYDMVVDAVAVGGGALITLGYSETGPGAAIFGTAGYLGVQAAAVTYVDPKIESFTDQSYLQIVGMVKSLNVTTIQTQPVVYPFGYPDQ